MQNNHKNSQQDTYIVIKDSLEFYDKNNEKCQKIFKRVHYVKWNKVPDDSTEHNIISMYDSDRKLVLESRYEYIGAYNNDSKTWIWAWSIPRYNKMSTTVARKLIKYGIDLDNNVNLKTELVNSRHKISIDILLACAAYLAKKRAIFPYYLTALTDTDSFGMIDISKQQPIANSNLGIDTTIYRDPKIQKETNYLVINYLALLDIDDMLNKFD